MWRNVLSNLVPKATSIFQFCWSIRFINGEQIVICSKVFLVKVSYENKCIKYHVIKNHQQLGKLVSNSCSLPQFCDLGLIFHVSRPKGREVTVNVCKREWGNYVFSKVCMISVITWWWPRRTQRSHPRTLGVVSPSIVTPITPDNQRKPPACLWTLANYVSDRTNRESKINNHPINLAQEARWAVGGDSELEVFCFVLFLIISKQFVSFSLPLYSCQAGMTGNSHNWVGKWRCLRHGCVKWPARIINVD